MQAFLVVFSMTFGSHLAFPKGQLPWKMPLNSEFETLKHSPPCSHVHVSAFLWSVWGAEKQSLVAFVVHLSLLSFRRGIPFLCLIYRRMNHELFIKGSLHLVRLGRWSKNISDPGPLLTVHLWSLLVSGGFPFLLIEIIVGKIFYLFKHTNDHLLINGYVLLFPHVFVDLYKPRLKASSFWMWASSFAQLFVSEVVWSSGKDKYAVGCLDYFPVCCVTYSLNLGKLSPHLLSFSRKMRW